jgi:hypothetical protein
MECQLPCTVARDVDAACESQALDFFVFPVVGILEEIILYRCSPDVHPLFEDSATEREQINLTPQRIFEMMEQFSSGAL